MKKARKCDPLLREWIVNTKWLVNTARLRKDSGLELLDNNIKIASGKFRQYMQTGKVSRVKEWDRNARCEIMIIRDKKFIQRAYNYVSHETIVNFRTCQ